MEPDCWEFWSVLLQSSFTVSEFSASSLCSEVITHHKGGGFSLSFFFSQQTLWHVTVGKEKGVTNEMHVGWVPFSWLMVLCTLVPRRTVTTRWHYRTDQLSNVLSQTWAFPVVTCLWKRPIQYVINTGYRWTKPQTHARVQWIQSVAARYMTFPRHGRISLTQLQEIVWFGLVHKSRNISRTFSGWCIHPCEASVS